MRQRVAIIGGGITGLAVAHHLCGSAAPQLDVVLLEATSRLGGVIQTTKKDGFLVESCRRQLHYHFASGHQSLPTTGVGGRADRDQPAGTRSHGSLQRQAGTDSVRFSRYGVSRIWPILTTRILSSMGKLQAGLEYFIPKRKQLDDESLKAFVCRRFGYEMFERLVQPLVGGIYTADPSRLSIAATMPRFPQMEQQQRKSSASDDAAAS
ncbi:MAG: protoporphyrinogen oxidase [Pirellulaceae bacterium]